MDIVNTWIAAIVGCLSIIAATAAGLRWLLSAMTKQMRVISTETAMGVARAVVTEVVGDAVGTLSARMDAMDERFDRMDGRLDRMDDRLDRMDDRLDRMDERFDQIDARIDRLDAKVDHFAEVVDLRLQHLETDMVLVKQHLLGSPAA